MTRTLLCSLLLGACVSRSEVGKEWAPTAQDAGVDVTPDGGEDASLSKEEEEARKFERDLIGSWQGTYKTTLGTLEVAFHFRAGSSFTLCIDDNGAWDCSSPSLYFVTDVQSNGRYAGELQSTAMGRPLYMDDMWIDDSEGKVLRFTMHDRLLLSGTVELTRVGD